MKNFVKLAVRTEAPVTEEVIKRLTKSARLVHAALGKLTEIGEFADELKKHIFYGKPLDPVNLMEEIGDGAWYDALALDSMGGSDLDFVLEKVIAKLKKRYPEKFTEKDALNRDLEAERKVLEKGNKSPVYVKDWDHEGWPPKPTMEPEIGKIFLPQFHVKSLVTGEIYVVEAASKDSALHITALYILRGISCPEGQNHNTWFPKKYLEIKGTLSITKEE